MRIITFIQKPNDAFNEAWERLKGLLRQCPHHGFSELHQLDTFYNSLNSNDQDALDSARGWQFFRQDASRRLTRSTWIVPNPLLSNYPLSVIRSDCFSSSPTLTPFDESDYYLKKADAFIAIDVETVSLFSNDYILLIPWVSLSFSRHFSTMIHYLNQTKEITYLEFKKISKLSNQRNLQSNMLLLMNPKMKFQKMSSFKELPRSVQHQRRVNPKIHDVIKKEVEKLLDTGLIYPISDSPWVSPIHCVPKKGGMTLSYEEKSLVPTDCYGWESLHRFIE
ncbi:hypothetical protein Tco_1217259 [Tanacetum coccineum]